MFTEMISALREGHRPSGGDLKRRLDLAVIKKGGILQQPKSCWSGDTKINPDAVHMLWASVILEDTDIMATVVGMIEIELSSGSEKKDLHEFLTEKLAELSSLPSDSGTVNWLNEKIRSVSGKSGLGI